MTESKPETSPSLGRVAEEIAVGATWMVLMRFALRALGIVSTLILARLLVPEDFGLVAMATLLIGLLDVISKMNLDAYLIYNQESGRRHYDSAWTMSIIRGVLAGVVVVALAKPASLFFGEPRVEEIFYWLALGSVVGGFVNIGIVDLRKNMQFDKDFTYFVIIKVVSFTVTITAAFILRSYWALILGMLSNTFAMVVLSFIMSPYRPRLGLSRWRKIFGFSKWLLITDILNYGANRIGILILGRIAGAASVGIYSMAFELATLATSEIVMPIRRVIFPGYAKLGNDPAALRRAFIEGLALILAITSPIAVGIGLTAHISVPLMLGPNWSDVVPILQVLTILAILQLSYANTVIVITTTGHPRIVSGIIAVQFVIAVPLVIVATQNWGAIGAAGAIALARVPTAAMAVYFAARLTDSRLWDVFKATWRSAAATILMTVGVISADNVIGVQTSIVGMLLSLMALIIFGGFVYLCTHFGLWGVMGRPRGAESNLVALAVRMWRKYRGAGEEGLAAP